MHVFDWFEDVNVLQEYLCSFELISSKCTSRNTLNAWQLKQWIRKLSFTLHDIQFTPKTSQIYNVQVYFTSKEERDRLKSLVSNGKTVNISGNVYNAQTSGSMEVDKSDIIEQYGDKKYNSLSGEENKTTLVIKALPLKWFDIDRTTLHGASSYKTSSTLQEAFNRFGSVKNIEATRSRPTTEQSDSLVIPSLNFDVYVLYERHEEFSNAMYHLANDKVMSKPGSELIVKLDVTVDTNGYFSESSIRRRRFQRDQFEHTKRENERLKRIEEENRQNEIKKVKKEHKFNCEALNKKISEVINYDLLDQDIQLVISRGKTLLTKDIEKLREETELYQISDEVKNVTSQITLYMQKLEEKEKKLKIKKHIAYWASKISFVQDTFRKKVDNSRQRLQELSKGDSAAKHEAVVAEILAAAASLDRADKVIDQSLTPVESVNDEHLSTYSQILEDYIEEAQDDTDRAVRRVQVVRSYLELRKISERILSEERILNASKDWFVIKLAEKLRKSIQDITQHWSSSTSDLKLTVSEAFIALQKLEDVFRRDQELVNLRNRLTSVIDDSLTKDTKESLDHVQKAIVDAFCSDNLSISSELSIQINTIEKKIAEDKLHQKEIEKAKQIEEEHRKQQEDQEKALRAHLEAQKQKKMDLKRCQVERNCRKRMRLWQENYFKKNKRYSEYYTQTIVHLPNRWIISSPTEKKQQIASSVPYDIMLHSKIVDISIKEVLLMDDKKEKVELNQVELNQAEQRLRNLALESKIRALAILKMKKLEIQKPKEDETKLRELALATLRKK